MTDTNQEVRETLAASDGWTRKRKGYSHIYTHPSVDRAIVDNRGFGFDPAILWDGQRYSSIEDAKAAALASAPPPAVPDAVGVREALRFALDESQSLLVAMLGEDRPKAEIAEQIAANRKALSSIEPTPSPEPQASNAGAVPARYEAFDMARKIVEPRLATLREAVALSEARAALSTPQPQTGERDEALLREQRRHFLTAQAAEALVQNLYRERNIARECHAHALDLAKKEIAAREAAEASNLRNFEQSQKNAARISELEAIVVKQQTGSAEAVQRERDRAEHAIEQQLLNERRYRVAEHRLAEVEERAREDERDRLYELSFSAPGSIAIVTPGFILDCGDTMLPADRAALRAKPEAHTLVGKEDRS